MILAGGAAGAQKIQIQSVNQAIQIALENNGKIKAGQLKINAAKIREKTASELPRLNLGTELGQYSSDQFDNAFQLTQTLPFPGIFGARKNLAEAETRASSLQQEITAADLKKEVRRCFYQIRYLQHNQQQLDYLDKQ